MGFSVVLDKLGFADKVALIDDATENVDKILGVIREESTTLGIPPELKLKDIGTGLIHRVDEFTSDYGITVESIFNSEKLLNTDNGVASKEQLLIESFLKKGFSVEDAFVKAKSIAYDITLDSAANIVKDLGFNTSYANVPNLVEDFANSALQKVNNLLPGELSTEVKKALGELDGVNFGNKTADFKTQLTSIITEEKVIFDVTPNIDESRSASYDAINPVHHPGAIQVYKSTNPRNFSLNAKLVCRTSDEATRNSKYINLIRSWLMPYYGTGTESDPLTSKRLGAPPDVLRLDAYGKTNLKNVPVVLTSYSWTYPDGVDYIPTNDGVPFPVIIDLSLMLTESLTPEQYSNFDLTSYKLGLFTEAFNGSASLKNSLLKSAFDLAKKFG